MKNHFRRVALVALALPWPLGAQSLATESHAAPALELGFFTYPLDGDGGFEVGAQGGVGYRVQRRWLFVEPQMRAVICEGDGCAVAGGDAAGDIPVFWPGIALGGVIGTEYFSQSLGLRGSFGVGADQLNGVVGLRYEGSARRFGWFAEIDSERLLGMGARVWLRRVTAPAPTSPPDAGIIATRARARNEPEPWLAVWANDDDARDSPFLAIIDVDPASAAYGTVVSTLAVGQPGASAHHTELPAPRDGRLWANSFSSGETFLFDLGDPLAPAVAARLAPAPGMTHPHSFAPLADGRLLVTYQLDEAGTGPGGIAIHDSEGRFVRGASAADSSSTAFVRPYSALVLESIDRVLTTGADMHGAAVSRVVQIWRLRDLHLLATLELPAGRAGTENAHSFEPRMLPDGSALVVTLGCGLYHVDDIESAQPRASLVHTFPDERCFMPAVVGYWWLQALARENAVEVLDLTDPRMPRVVSRLQLPDGWVPHWLAPDRRGERIVLTGYSEMERRVVLLSFDRRTGALDFDPRFGTGGFEAPGIALDGPEWPHGETGPAVPHGAVFFPR